MKTKKYLGIWMDHSMAHLMELSNGTFITETIESKPNLQVNPADLYYKDESHQLNKEQGILSNYFNRLIEKIKYFDEVILFGPTVAKTELSNLMGESHNLDHLKITIKTTDKMSENQMQALVREFFNASGKPAKNFHNSSFFFF